MGFRSLALQKRSSEVWQLLGAIKGEFDKYGDVVSSLARQLNAASNSVDSLGKRPRVMSRKLKDVEVLSDQHAAERLLGFSGDNALDGGFEVRAKPRSLKSLRDRGHQITLANSPSCFRLASVNPVAKRRWRSITIGLKSLAEACPRANRS